TSTGAGQGEKIRGRRFMQLTINKVNGTLSLDTPPKRLRLLGTNGNTSPDLRQGVQGVLLLTLSIAVFVARTAQAADIDWAQVEQDATALLSAYIQIDTTNPPGNETAAARFLAQRFHDAGIDAETFESEPGRGSVLARLKGRGTAKPIILLNHL